MNPRLEKQLIFFILERKKLLYIYLIFANLITFGIPFISRLSTLPVGVFLGSLLVSFFVPYFFFLWVIRRYTAGYPSLFDPGKFLAMAGCLPFIGGFILSFAYEKNLQILAKEGHELTPKKRLAWFDAKAKQKRVVTLIDNKPLSELWKETDFDPATDTKFIL